VRLSLEPLEDRRVLAVTAVINVDGDLVINGDGNANTVTVTINAGGQIAVTHADGTDLFDPADVTSHQIEIDLGNGSDTLNLALLQNSGTRFDISVDMGGGVNDVVNLRENVGAGALAPFVDLTSGSIEHIHLGGALGDAYSTSGVLTLQGDVVLDGSATITTNGGNFVATNATISALDANTNDALVPEFDLTINTGAGEAHIGVLNDDAGAHISAFSVNSSGAVTFEAVSGAGNNVTVGSLSVQGGTITVEDSISVTSGDAIFESDGLMTFDPPGGAANVVIDTHGHDLTFISGVTGGAAFSIDSNNVIFQSTGGGGTVAFRPDDPTAAIQIGTPAVPDPLALQINPAIFGEFTGYDGFEIGGATQSGLISVVSALSINTDVDLHLHAGAGDLLIDAVVDIDGDLTVTGDGSTTTINANMTAGSLDFNDDVVIAAPTVTLRANGGVGNITFDSTIDSEAGEENDLILDANGSITVTGAIGTGPRINNLTIDDADDVTFSSTVRLAGTLEQTTGSGTTTFNGTSGTGIAGQLDVTTNAVTFNTADMIVVGAVNVEADNAITLNAGINAGASPISLAANQDNAGAQGFTQNAGVIQTTNAAAAVTIAVGGTGSAAVGAIQAATGTVVVDSAGGAITDNNGGTVNVTASLVALDAATGVGADANAIEITAGTLAARSVSGDINIVDTAGGLVIGTVPGILVGVQLTGGAVGDNVQIITTGALTVNNAVTSASGGSVTLVAGGVALTDDLTINANVTTSGNGSISLFAGDSIQVTAPADVEASGTGGVLLSAGTDARSTPVNGTSTGSIAIDNGSEITSDDGDIILRAPGNVSFSLIDANDDNDATVGDVAILADFAGVGGGLSDGVGTITINAGAPNPSIIADGVALTAGTGIGDDADAFEITANAVAARTTTGDIHIEDTAGGLTIGTVLGVTGITITNGAVGDNIRVTATNGSLTVAQAVTNTGGGDIFLTATGAAGDVILQQDVTTTGLGNVTATAGRNIVDDGNAATIITTNNLSLSAVGSIGDITDFATGTGTPVDVAVSGLLLQAAITAVGGEIFIRAQGNLTAGAAAISPAAGGAATALVTATGNLDVGTNGGLAATAGDNLGLLAGGILTVPAAGIDVGATGNLRLEGVVDVVDGDHILGPFVANSLDFLSGSLLATQLTTNVALLTAEMTALGTSLTVLEQDGITLQSVTTNDGIIVVILANAGNISVQLVDAGTALAALVAAPLFPFAGNGAILDADGAGVDTVDVIGGQVLLLATQGIGTDLNALDIDGVTLAAATVTGDINITDLAGGVTIDTISGFVGVQVTGGVLGDDIRITAEGVGADLTVNALVSTIGSGAITVAADDGVSITAIGAITAVTGNVNVDAGGAVSLAAVGSIVTNAGNIDVDAGGDVLFTGTASITTVAGNVSIDAGGGISMVDGTQIVKTAAGLVELLAQGDIGLSRVQNLLGEVTVTSTGGAITDTGDLLGANISAVQTALSAADGIGALNAIETEVGVLSAENTVGGGIAVVNTAAALSIGTVGGIIGLTSTNGAISVTNSVDMDVDAAVDATGALGNVSLVATTGNLQLNAPVSAGNDMALTAGIDLSIDDPVAMLGAQVLADGAIVLTAGNNILLNNTGLADDVRGDTVTGSAGNAVVFNLDVIVRSTGAGAGAIADKLPDFTPLVPSVNNDPVLLAQLPFLTVTFNIGRAGEENLSVVVEFDIEDTDSGIFDGTNLNAALTGTLFNSGGGFFIRYTVTDPTGITFFEGGVEVALPPIQFDFLPIFVPINIQLPQATPITSALPDQAPAETFVALIPPIQQQTTFDDLPITPDAPQATDVRIIIVEKIDSNDDVERDRNDDPILKEFVDAEAEQILENPSKLFEQLKSGRFRIWLKDGVDAPRNLIWDVILRDGRPQPGGEGTERPPTDLPAEAPEGAMPEGAAAPAPKTSEVEVPSLPAVDEGPALPVAPATSSIDFEQDALESSGQQEAAVALPLPASPEHGWRTARRIDSTSTSAVRSNSP